MGVAKRIKRPHNYHHYNYYLPVSLCEVWTYSQYVMLVTAVLCCAGRT
jgi:hypothetical protein